MLTNKLFFLKKTFNRSASVLYSAKGKLPKKQPCEVCGEIKVHGHHDDYAKPLKIRWLCAKHHRLWHAINKAKNLNLAERFYHCKLPCVPIAFVRKLKALGWEEGQPMEMALSSDGIDIRKLETKETK